jgi:hypothetical protein
VSVEPLPVVTDAPVGIAETVYEVIGEPPLDDGAFHVTVACPLPAVAVTFRGTLGTVAIVGVTAAEEALVGESPAALVARTRKV